MALRRPTRALSGRSGAQSEQALVLALVLVLVLVLALARTLNEYTPHARRPVSSGYAVAPQMNFWLVRESSTRSAVSRQRSEWLTTPRSSTARFLR